MGKKDYSLQATANVFRSESFARNTTLPIHVSALVHVSLWVVRELVSRRRVTDPSVSMCPASRKQSSTTAATALAWSAGQCRNSASCRGALK